MADTPQPSEPAQQRPLPGARVALVLLLCINLFNYIDRQVLAAVVPDIEKEFFPPEESANQGATAPAFLKAFITFLAPAEKSYAKAMMGLLATAFMLTYMITAPLFGWLAERYSRWVLIGIGVILWSLASGASGLAETFTLLLLTRCLVGVGEGAYGPAAPTLIADLYPARMRSTVLGWFYMAIPVGSALGYVLGGAVASIKEGAWRWSFYLVVVPGILLGVWAFTMREPRRGQTAASGAPKPHARLRDYRTFLLTPSYILNTLGMTAMTFAVGGIAYWMPYYILREKGQESLAVVNLVFGAIVVVSGLAATIVGGLAGDWAQRRWRGGYFLISGLTMLLAFPMVLGVLWAPSPWFWVFIFFSVFCLYFNTGPTNTILANVTHPAVRESAFAVNIFLIHAAGDAISPFVIGLIADSSNLGNGFLAVSGTVLLGGFFWLWGTRYQDRDTALAPTRLTIASPTS